MIWPHEPGETVLTSLPGLAILAQKGERMSAAQRMQGATSVAGGETRRVLLIEDEPNIAEAVRFVLARDGLRVDLHGRGDDALARLAEIRPDAVILDIMLPGLSGLELLARLRGHPDPALAGLPVLMLTARGLARDRAAAQQAGATRFLAKPFSNDDLRHEVAQLLSGRAGDA